VMFICKLYPAVLKQIRYDLYYMNGQARSLKALGPVDSKDSLLPANQIQSCFLGGSLGL